MCEIKSPAEPIVQPSTGKAEVKIDPSGDPKSSDLLKIFRV